MMSGEENWDSLDDAERQAAEDRAIEQNPYGTGGDPDAETSYDYYADDLTDTDFQPGTDFSADFTGGFNDNDDYAVTDNDDDEAKDADDDDEPDEAENWDGDDEDDDDDDGEAEYLRERENADALVGTDDIDRKLDKLDKKAEKREKRALKTGKQQSEWSKKREKKKRAKLEAEKAAREKQNRIINWKEGDPITVAVLTNVWTKCKRIEPVKPLMEAANEAVRAAMATAGDTLIIKLNEAVSRIEDDECDTIGCLLKLAESDHSMKRLFLTGLSVAKAIFTQGWVEVTLLATLPTIVEGILATSPIKEILEKIFKLAVPIINKASDLHDAGQKNIKVNIGLDHAGVSWGGD